MDELLIGTVLPGAIAIHNENINPVWRANVVVDTGRQKMYVKQVCSRTLAVEVICAVVGRAIGLPIPRPALVQVRPGVLEGINQTAVLFGSQSVDNPDLKQWLRRGEDMALSELMGWAKFIDAGCFDEWTANADRHGGNILYGGGKNFVLIDHSEALPNGLAHSAPAATNKLLVFASAQKTPKQLHELYQKARFCSHPFGKVSVHAHVQATLEAVAGKATTSTLVQFLEQRIQSLMMLISNRIGYAQPPLVL